jgi:predicted nucleotidyltransferase
MILEIASEVSEAEIREVGEHRAIGETIMDQDKKLSELTQRLVKAFGANLESAVLYGSAAAGDHHARFSDLNILCLLREIGTRQLRAAEPVFHWWRELGNPSPLLMSVEEMRGSADCFPIEFHDIRRWHRILHGENLVATLEIDDRHYRAQVEYQLRAKLLRLRQKGAGVLDDRALLLGLMADSVSTFCNLGRHVLLLLDGDAPAAKRDVARRLTVRLQIDAGPLETLLAVREGSVKRTAVDAAALFARYLQCVAQLIQAADGIVRGRDNKE